MCWPTVIPVTTWLGEGGIQGDEENLVDIYLSGYNIQNGCNRGSELALRAIKQMNMELVFLFEIYITGSVY